MNRRGLEAAVFVCGAAMMCLELAGSRIMAPFVGTSIYVWTSLIGVILACMSAGYSIGGKLADRKNSPNLLSLIIFGAGVWTGLLSLVCDPVLSAIQSVLTDVRISAVVGALILFGAPGLLLGMVLPFAAKLKLSQVETAGRTVGNLYALSTVGSIVGTFLAGFYLLAYFRNSTVLLILSGCMVTASWLVKPNALAKKLIVMLGIGLSVTAVDFFTARVYGKDFVDVNTAYNRVWIYDLPIQGKKDIFRIMQINDEMSSMKRVGDETLVAQYTRYYRLDAHFKPDLKRALMLGGAGYSYPMDFLAHHKEAVLDVVEIDPGVTRLAEKYFDLKKNSPRLQIFHEDARTYVNHSREKYDAVYMDAFKSSSVPFHLTTLQMMEKVSALMSDDAVFIVNTISSIEGEEGAFLRAELATLKKVFPQVYVFPVQDRDDAKKVQNIMVVALKSKKIPKFYSRDFELHEYLQHLWLGEIAMDKPVLEDDFAPVERYQSGMSKALVHAENVIFKRWKQFFDKIG